MDNVVELPTNGPDNPFSKYNTPACKLFFPVGERPVGWLTRSGSYEPTKSHKAIIRLDPRGDRAMLLNVVGDGYKLVHNRELFSAVESAMMEEMLPEHLHDVQVTDRVAGFGKVCMRQYIFPSIRCKLQHTKSVIAFRLIVQNGYGGSGLRMHAGAIDTFCTNGMISGEYTSTYRRHTSGLVIGQLNENVKTALHEFANGQLEWQRWADKPIKFEQAMKLFENIALSARMKEKLSDQYTREVDERGSNVWALYSALTYYASHNDGAFSMRRSVEEMDTVATVMLERELNVARWIQTPAWKELEAV